MALQVFKIPTHAYVSNALSIHGTKNPTCNTGNVSTMKVHVCITTGEGRFMFIPSYTKICLGGVLTGIQLSN